MWSGVQLDILEVLPVLPFSLLLLLCLVLPGSLSAQRITVAVAMSDSAAGRVLQGAFVAAFRSLSNVDVVSVAERPEYVLSGVVLCNPVSCQDPSSYSAALRLWSPIRRSTARTLAMLLVPQQPSGTFDHRVDSATTQLIWPVVSGLEETHSEWVVAWGRDRYEQAIRELVRKIDTDCLERSRAYYRAFASNDSTVWRPIFRMISARTWLCQ